MVYDKPSFLAGMAVGRNMESWPAMKGENVFRFTITTDGSTFYTPWMVFAGTIYWGDGTSSTYNNIPTNYYESEAFRGRTYHTYTEDGVYQITLIGTLLDWSVRRSSADLAYSDYLISIDTPFPRSMKDKTFLALACYGCRSLIKLPPKLFKNCPMLQNLYAFCWRCSSLDEIPEKLFWGCGNVTNVSRFFMSCDLTGVPADLFAQMTAVENAAGMISYNRRITEIPQGLIDPLEELQNAFGLNSIGISTIPEGFFANQPYLENFDYLCNESTFLNEIPEDLFFYAPGAKSFEYAFAGTAITKIPTGLFRRNSMAENFESCFRDCTLLTGAAPELWERFPTANGYACFRGCVNAQNYEEIPNDWK